MVNEDKNYSVTGNVHENKFCYRLVIMRLDIFDVENIMTELLSLKSDDRHEKPTLRIMLNSAGGHHQHYLNLYENLELYFTVSIMIGANCHNAAALFAISYPQDSVFMIDSGHMVFHAIRYNTKNVTLAELENYCKLYREERDRTFAIAIQKGILTTEDMVVIDNGGDIIKTAEELSDLGVLHTL